MLELYPEGHYGGCPDRVFFHWLFFGEYDPDHDLGACIRKWWEDPLCVVGDLMGVGENVEW